MKKIIETPQEYRQAIRSCNVKEVSPDLIGTLTRSSFGTLSRRDRKYAWVSSSSNLYQFLVLNQRYSIGDGDQKTGDLTVVSEEAIDGLSRIVGIPNPPFNNLFEDLFFLLIL